MKRFFAVLLAVLMLVTMIPVSVSAAGEEAMLVTPTGSVLRGTLRRMIEKAAENVQACTVTLLRDIDGSTWTSMYLNGGVPAMSNGVETTIPRQGALTIDGAGYKITGLTQPLFDVVDNGPMIEIKNLTIEGANIPSQLVANPDPMATPKYFNGHAGIIANRLVFDHTDDRGGRFFKLTNCTITNSSVTGVNVGALFGEIVGEEEAFPRFGRSQVIISNCTVTNCAITTVDTSAYPNDTDYEKIVINCNAGGLIGMAALGADYSAYQSETDNNKGYIHDHTWMANIEVERSVVKNNTITTTDGKNARRTGKIVGRVDRGVVAIEADETNNVISETYRDNGSTPTRSHELVHGRIDGGALVITGGIYDAEPIYSDAWGEPSYELAKDEISYYDNYASLTTADGRLGYGTRDFTTTIPATHDIIVGYRANLTPTYTPTLPGQNGLYCIVETASWASSNPAIVSVDNGKLVAHAEGTATVSYTVNGGAPVSCVVTVRPTTDAITSVNLRALYGQTKACVDVPFVMIVQTRGAYYNYTSIEWSVNAHNSAGATIDENGVLMATKPGQVTVTAKVTGYNGVFYASKRIDVVEADTLPDATKASLWLGGQGMKIGDKLQHHVTLTPQNSKIISAEWTTADPNVVTVDQQGRVTAVGPGNGKVTVTITTANGVFTDYCTHPIRLETPVSEYVIEEDEISLKVGATYRPKRTMTPQWGSYNRITYATSDPAVATFEDGKVTAVAPGTAIITTTLTSAAGTFTDTCTVTVTPATVPTTGVTLDKETIALVAGNSQTLAATLSPENGVYTAINWASSNPAVATVDANGKVTAVAAGTADVTVTVTTAAGTVSDTCAVTVTPATVPTSGVALDKETIALVAGNSQTLAATLSPENGVYTAINWASSNPAVATVDATGKVTAVAAGTADVTVTVTTAAGTVSDTCAVTVSAVAAKIDEDVFASFDDALSAVESGETIVLTASATSTYALAMNAAHVANLTLDLGGNTLTVVGIRVGENATLAIKNGTVVDASPAENPLFTVGGKLTLNNVTAKAEQLLAVNNGQVSADASNLSGDVVLNNTTSDPSAVKLTLTSPVADAYNGINLSFAPNSNAADVNRKDDSAVAAPDGFVWAGDSEGNKVLVKDIPFTTTIMAQNKAAGATLRAGDVLTYTLEGLANPELYEHGGAWYRDGEQIAYGQTYTLTSEDLGHTITVIVSLSTIDWDNNPALGLASSPNFVVPKASIFDIPLVGVSQIKLIDAETGNPIVGATVELWRIGTTGNRTLQKTYTSTSTGCVTMRTLSSRYTYEAVVVAAEGYAPMSAPFTFRIQFNQPLYQTITLEKLPAETPAE